MDGGLAPGCIAANCQAMRNGCRLQLQGDPTTSCIAAIAQRGELPSDLETPSNAGCVAACERGNQGERVECVARNAAICTSTDGGIRAGVAVVTAKCPATKVDGTCAEACEQQFESCVAACPTSSLTTCVECGDPCASTYFSCKGKCAPVPEPADAGVCADAGLSPDVGPVVTTIPVINHPGAAGHAKFATPPCNLVHFKGVVVSPVFRDYKKGTGTDPAGWYCKMGVYLADPSAAAEHNGVLLLSKSSVLPAADGAAGNCAGDSALEKAAGGSSWEVGEELEVTGYFREDCYRTDPAGPCDNVDQYGQELSRAVVESNDPQRIVRTGRKPGLPASLPVLVEIAAIASGPRSGTTPPYATTVGPRWRDYRQVLVKVEGVRVVDAAGPSCNWTVQKAGGTGPTLNVQDDVMFLGTTCLGRPPLGTDLQAVTGLSAWYTNATLAETQLAPRDSADLVK